MRKLAWWVGLLGGAALLALLMDPGAVRAQQSPGQWKGLVAGKSTQDEVFVTLGRPKQTTKSGDLEELYWTPSLPPGKAAGLDNAVVMRKGVVQYMMVADPAELEPNFDKAMEKLGKAQGVTRAGFSANSHYYHYPLRGVSFLVDSGPTRRMNTVVAKMIYPPTDWATLQANYPWARPYAPRQ